MWAALDTFEEIHLAEEVVQEVRVHVPVGDRPARQGARFGL
jgi:hypothetical protein